MKIKFRPHHFLCSLCFEGKGYSTKFVKNFTQIVAELRSENGDDILIEVTEGVDDNVCSACPKNIGKICKQYEITTPLDKAHIEILRLKTGDELTWGEAKQRLKKYMTIENHHKACAKCEWLKYGMCEGRLRDLHNTD
jgi:hypothetical protein